MWPGCCPAALVGETSFFLIFLSDRPEEIIFTFTELSLVPKKITHVKDAL